MILPDFLLKVPRWKQKRGRSSHYTKDHIATHYLPYLPPKLHATVQEALDNRRLRTMPNSFLPSSMQGLSSNISGAIMVGDAWNMRLPLTGGGMTVALHDAVLLTEYLRPSEELPAGREGLQDWDVVSVKLKEWFWKRKDVAGSINVLSMALYDLFGGADREYFSESSDQHCPSRFRWRPLLTSRHLLIRLCQAYNRTEPELEILREGVFRYFELGGECIAGPIGLLSASVASTLLESEESQLTLHQTDAQTLPVVLPLLLRRLLLDVHPLYPRRPGKTRGEECKTGMARRPFSVPLLRQGREFFSLK